MIDIAVLWNLQDAQDLYKHKNNQRNIPLKPKATVIICDTSS